MQCRLPWCLQGGLYKSHLNNCEMNFQEPFVEERLLSYIHLYGLHCRINLLFHWGAFLGPPLSSLSLNIVLCFSIDDLNRWSPALDNRFYAASGACLSRFSSINSCELSPKSECMSSSWRRSSTIILPLWKTGSTIDAAIFPELFSSLPTSLGLSYILIFPPYLSYTATNISRLSQRSDSRTRRPIIGVWMLPFDTFQAMFRGWCLTRGIWEE